MNRMDPKTFLGSLLDWSSGITKQHTNWVVSSDDFEIFVQEQADKQSVDYGTLSFNMKTPGGNDIYSFELLTDSFISVFERQVITQGMSAVSEKYWDRIVDQANSPQNRKVHVSDANTRNKRKTDIDKTRGFTKPIGAPDAPETPHDWSTSVLAVPEIYSNMDIGMRYDEYIDGRARKSFLDMLNLNMRVKFRTTGIGLPALASSHNLGVSHIKVMWRDNNNNPYFLDGDWLVYGFHHIMTVGHWYTDLYCYRLPWDATGQNV